MIKLFYNDGFEYKHKDNTYIKGYFYKGFDNLSAENVFNELSDIKDEKNFSSFLKSIDGCFQIKLITVLSTICCLNGSIKSKVKLVLLSIS